MHIFGVAREIWRRRRRVRALQFLLSAGSAPRAWQYWRYVCATTLATWPDSLRFALTQKAFRPYLRRRFSSAKKVAIIDAHYRLLDARLPRDFAEFYTWPGLRIGSVAGKSGRNYEFFLELLQGKEGEFDVFLMDDETRSGLAMMASVLANEDGKTVLYIGGLRGIKPPHGKAEIVAATRDLHGLRPKAAVFHATCQIAALFGAEKVIAPTLDNHITRWAGGESRTIHADYDGFWREYNPQQRADGDYSIPITLPYRDPATVKRHKRAEWARRKAMVEDLNKQIRERIG